MATLDFQITLETPDVRQGTIIEDSCGMAYYLMFVA